MLSVRQSSEKVLPCSSKLPRTCIGFGVASINPSIRPVDAATFAGQDLFPIE